MQAGEVALLDELERRAATGADVVDLVGEAELADRRRAVAATDDGERARRGDRVGDGAGAGRERRELEHAHGPFHSTVLASVTMSA